MTKGKLSLVIGTVFYHIITGTYTTIPKCLHISYSPAREPYGSHCWSVWSTSMNHTVHGLVRRISRNIFRKVQASFQTCRGDTLIKYPKSKDPPLYKSTAIRFNSKKIIIFAE